MNNILDVYEPWEIREFTNDYVRRLLLERHHIRAAVENSGGSIILTAAGIIDSERRDVGYSSQIGNSFHLDLIEVEEQLSELPKGVQNTILSYIDGYNDQQAAYYLGVKGGVAIRQRRLQAINRLVGRLNERRRSRESDVIGGSSDGDIGVRREAESHDTVQVGDTGQSTPTNDPAQGNTLLDTREEA